MSSLSVKHVGTGDDGFSNFEPMMKLPKAALVLGDASLQYSSEVARRSLRKDSCLLFTIAFAGVALIVGISLTGFLMTHLTSNVFSAQGFMTNMLASIDGTLEQSVDPVYNHLQTSLNHIRFRNVSTWEGISALTPWRLSFLSSFFGNYRRSVIDFANMAFAQEDVESEGGYDKWLPPHDEADDFGDDLAIGSITLVGWSNLLTNTTEVRTFDEEGSNTNDWWVSVRDDTTFNQWPGYFFPITADPRVPTDYRRREIIDTTWKDVHRWDLQPRQVHFTNIFFQGMISPGALFVGAIMPVYERNTPGADPGRRVRVTGVSFELPFLTHQLSMMDLQGGFVFLVEESTGILVAASDTSLSVLGDGENGTGTEFIYPIDSTHPLVRGAAQILKSTDSWPTLSDQLVQGEIDGVNHFFQCFLFHRYNFSLVGVYVIPAHIILGDVSSRAVLGSVFNVMCSVAFVVSIFVGVCHRFRKLRRDAQEQSRAMKLKVQEVNLAVGIAQQLANYDLRAAEQVLKGQGFASERVTQPLQQLLDNLTSYAPFLPDSLFTRLHGTEARRGTPNETLAGAMEGKTASLRSVEACTRRLRDPSYTLLAFARDVENAFPELILYTTAETLSSGLDAIDEFERTMGALYATYCLLRLDLDGKEIFSFGVDASGCALREPKDHHHKKLEFYSTMNWPAITDLVVRADLLRLDARGKTWVESATTFSSNQGNPTHHHSRSEQANTQHPNFPGNTEQEYANTNSGDQRDLEPHMLSQTRAEVASPTRTFKNTRSFKTPRLQNQPSPPNPKRPLALSACWFCWSFSCCLVGCHRFTKFLKGKIVLRHDRVVAMLVLTVVHDVMKNTALLPRVRPQHAPYHGHGAGECINDHDVALAYVMECFPHLLPSYNCLEPGQRAPVLFSQEKMGFNNGWLVQGEAPPSVLFSKFKQVISRGRIPNADISFYLVHWLTDLAGA